MKTEVNKAKIWQEIIETVREQVRPKQEGEMTVQDFSTMSGINYDAARDFLEAQVKQGKMKKRKVKNMGAGGNICFYDLITEN